MYEFLIIEAAMLLYVADDSLDVSKMNVKPGGKQIVMRNGFWNEEIQKRNFEIGIILLQRHWNLRELHLYLLISWR